MFTKDSRSIATSGSGLGPSSRTGITRWPRRSLLAAGVAAALVVTACGSDDSGDEASESSSVPGRTIEHKYGVTEVPESPERVVTVGLVDHDAVLALDVVPVGLTANAYSEGQPHGVWPWAQDALGDGEPEVLPFPELNYERIRALRPDLILAIYSGLTEDEYGKLSQIAPTVAQSGDYDDYETPWDEMTRTIGQALGREQEAEDAIAQVEQAFAQAREDHPEFEGKVAVYAGFLEAGQYYVETEGSTRFGVLAELGFTGPDDIEADNFYAEVSQEQIELLDRDLLLWELGDTDSEDAIRSDPIYAQLDVASEGRDVFITDETLAGGLALISVLSLPYLVNELVPLLADALEGAGE